MVSLISGMSGMAIEHAGDAVDLAAGEDGEDHDQRVHAEAAAHDDRDEDVALDLLDEDERDDHPQGRERASRRRRPRVGGTAASTGPRYGMASMSPAQTPKNSA